MTRNEELFALAASLRKKVLGAKRSGVSAVYVAREELETLLDYVRELEAKVAGEEPVPTFSVGDRVQEICDETDPAEIPVGTVVELHVHKDKTLYIVALETTKHSGRRIMYHPEEIFQIEKED